MKIGLPSLLFVIFLVLKLCGLIAWPWIWVLSPLWISALIGMMVIALIAILCFQKDL